MHFNFPVLGSEENVPHEHANEVGLKPDEGHDIVVNVHPVFFILGLSKKGRGGEKKKGEKKKKLKESLIRNVTLMNVPHQALQYKKCNLRKQVRRRKVVRYRHRNWHDCED